MVEHKRSLCACLPPEPGHIPELLLDTAVPLSEEAPDGPTVPRPQAPQDLPEALIDPKGQAGESLVFPPLTPPPFYSKILVNPEWQ